MMANQANPFDQFDAPASAASAATSANPFDQFDQAPIPAGQLPTVVVHPTAQQTADAQPSWFQTNIARPAEMTGRAVVQGAMGVPELLHDALIRAPYNAIASAVGSDSRISPGAAQVDNWMNSAGIPDPQPQNGVERFAQNIDRGAGGLLTGVGVGGMLNNAASPVAQGVGNALTSNLGSQAAATVTGTTASQIAKEAGAGPVGQTIAGLAGGLAVPAVQAVPGALVGTADQQALQLAQKAKNLGIDVTAPQLSSSMPMKIANSVTAKIPFSGAQNVTNNQTSQFNRAINRTIGLGEGHPNYSASTPEAPTVLTPQIYDGALSESGDRFNTLYNNNPMPITAPTLSKLIGISNQAKQLPDGGATYNAMNANIDHIVANAPTGVLPGRIFGLNDSELGSLRAAGGATGNLYGKYQDALRDAMQSNMSPADAAALQNERAIYQNLMTVKPLVAKATGTDGNISPALLASQVMANGVGKNAMARGTRGDLGDLAAIGQRFIKPQVEGSNTAQKLLYQGALTGGVGGTVGYASFMNPSTILPAAAIAGTVIGGGRATQSLLNSRMLYNTLSDRSLRNALGAFPQSSPSYLNALQAISQNAMNANNQQASPQPVGVP